MRVLIVDDEPSAQRRLARLLARHPEVEVVGEAQDGLEALRLVESQSPDVIFLDIQMPELDGFGVVRALQAFTPSPLIIFATVHDQHALAAFEANAVAYLLKPVDDERLTTVVERCRLLLGRSNDRGKEKQRILRVIRTEKHLHRLVCRKGNSVMLLEPSEILWFFTDSGIVRARTATETYWVNYQLHQLEQRLDGASFFRARREVLVNLNKVKAIKPYDRNTFMLVMDDSHETELKVSERQAKDLRQCLPGL